MLLVEVVLVKSLFTTSRSNFIDEVSGFSWDPATIQMTSLNKPHNSFRVFCVSRSYYSTARGFTSTHVSTHVRLIELLWKYDSVTLWLINLWWITHRVRGELITSSLRQCLLYDGGGGSPLWDLNYLSFRSESWYPDSGKKWNKKNEKTWKML